MSIQEDSTIRPKSKAELFAHYEAKEVEAVQNRIT